MVVEVQLQMLYLKGFGMSYRDRPNTVSLMMDAMERKIIPFSTISLNQEMKLFWFQSAAKSMLQICPGSHVVPIHLFEKVRKLSCEEFLKLILKMIIDR